MPKNADFLRFFWVSTISRGSNQETLEPLYRTKPSFDDTLMRSIHSGFPWVFPEFSDPDDATNSTRAAVRTTTARLASRRQSVEPRRCEKGFSATPNDGPSQPGGPRAAHALRGRRDGKSAVARCLGRTNNAHAPAPALSSTSADWSAHAGLPRSTALAGLHLDALALASRSIVVHNY